MKEQQKKSRLTLIIIFAVSIIPFGYAWYLSKDVSWIGKGTNNGELIIPVVTTGRSEFVGFDDFSVKNVSELAGHWVLMNVIVGNECNLVCQESLFKTKQLRLMMNKDLTRIRRLVVLMADVNADNAQHWWKDDLRLLRVKPGDSLRKKMQQIPSDGLKEGMLLLMDPLGNLMMRYEPGFDVYKVKKDLGKLLRISQIG